MLARLYPILDIDLLAAHSLDIASVATAWQAAGVTLVQYRNKHGSTREMLATDLGSVADFSVFRRRVYRFTFKHMA